jgi:hypothetical protein
MILRPTLSSIGEAHELAHHAGSEHGLLDQGQPSEDRAGDGAAQEGQGSGTLHVLSHFAHCCGQSSLVAPEGLVAVAAPLQAMLSAQSAKGQVARGRWPTPFRPPIVA